MKELKNLLSGIRGLIRKDLGGPVTISFGLPCLMVFFALQLACAPSEEVKKDEPTQTTILKVDQGEPSVTAKDVTKSPVPAAATVPAPAITPTSREGVKSKKQAAGAESVIALPQSTLEITGDSTLKKYSSKATQLGLRIKVEPSPRVPDELLKAKLSEFLLVIPVSGLKSGTGLLDEHLNEALKSKQFSDIRGVVKSYEVKGKNPDGTYRVTASVDLTVAGTEKTVPVDAIVSVEGPNVRIKGEKQLLMTDFNVKPPTLMFGTIKTANEIAIHFDILLGLV